MADNRYIVIFDGVCNFCNGTVNFIIARDPPGKFAFVALQSNAGARLVKELSVKVISEDSFVLVKNVHCYFRSDAAFEVAKDLTGFWHLVRLFRILPVSFRDGIYNLVAKNRYRLFGRRSECMIPSAETRARFIVD